MLWTFAVAQPLFDLLKDNPEFFAARGSSGFDIVSFSVLLVVLPPALLLAVELLIGLAGARAAARGAHRAAGRSGGTDRRPGAQEGVRHLGPGADRALGRDRAARLALLWLRAEPVRSFLNILSPVPLVFLLLFLLSGQISELAFPSEAKARTIGGVTQAPIVVVLLDELPSTTLMDADGKLDTRRFPGFGELAKNATWFRNAYTVYDSTERAQPAIMDGNLPEEDHQPISGDHPNSIFSLFGKTHRMNVSEEATTVCSRDLCEDERLDESYGSRMSSMAEDLGLVWLHVVSPPEIENDLASVSENWGNFGGGGEEVAPGEGQDPSARTRARTSTAGARPASPSGSTRSMTAGVPSSPSSTPCCRTCRGSTSRRATSTGAPNDMIPGLSNQSYRDQGQLDVLLQRHVLQTGFADLQLRRCGAS